MAPTMSWSEAEHDPRVSESCGETGRSAQGTTTHVFPAGFVPQALSKAGGNWEAGGWVPPETEGKGVAAGARE